MKARAQHANERQRPRADLAAGYARRQRRPVAALALGAHAAVQTVLLHLGGHRRNIEHLVAHRLALHGNRAAALANLNRRAVMHGIDLSLWQQLPVRPRMALLSTALALAGAPLSAVATTGAVR